MEAVPQRMEMNLEQALLSGTRTASKNKLEVEIYSGIDSVRRELAAHLAEKDENREKILVSDEAFDTVANESPPVDYSFLEEQFLAGLRYGAPALDYVKLWYGDDKGKPAEYISGTDIPGTGSTADSLTDGQSDMLTAKEAEEIFMEIQYHAMAGNIYQMNAQDLRKFNLSIIFDTALFKLRESLLGLTRNVNYWMM